MPLLLRYDHIIKMSILPKLNYKYNEVPVKNTKKVVSPVARQVDTSVHG